MGRRALGQAAKLRCGGSNPPGASNPRFVRSEPRFRRSLSPLTPPESPSSDPFFIRLTHPMASVSLLESSANSSPCSPFPVRSLHSVPYMCTGISNTSGASDSFRAYRRVLCTVPSVTAGTLPLIDSSVRAASRCILCTSCASCVRGEITVSLRDRKESVARWTGSFGSGRKAGGMQVFDYRIAARVILRQFPVH